MEIQKQSSARVAKLLEWGMSGVVNKWAHSTTRLEAPSMQTASEEPW
jgi:hypothetical protein